MDRDFKKFANFVIALVGIAVATSILVLGVTIHALQKHNREKAWCTDHSGVYIQRHCFSKEVVLR